MSLSVPQRKQLPSEQALDIMRMLRRTDVASMELSNSRFGAIATSNAKVLPLHFMMRLGIRPAYHVDADGNFPGRAWPFGADWEISYGYARRKSRERPDMIIGPLPNVDDAWNLFCELLKRSCVCGEISISFVNFTPALVQTFVAAENTGSIMQRARTTTARGTNEDLFYEAVASTEDNREDYRLFLTSDTDDYE